MKSIKPGRGPSGIGFIGSLCAMAFGVFWTVMAFAMTANVPGIFGMVFPLFGIVFIVIAGLQAVYHYKNATGKSRFSMMDITDSSEEGDPSEDWVRDINESTGGLRHSAAAGEAHYCPFCGAAVEAEHKFCKRCGKPV